MTKDDARSDHRRYQVFLSSTFSDLQEERQAVTQAILRMNRCIPAGMELFTASSQPPWDVIVDALGGTDYLVLIVGNRYGSVSAGENVSYTEKEYAFAIAHQIPVLPFISEDRPLFAGQIESKKSRKSLKAFIAKLQAAHTVERWTTKEDLEIKVPTALTQEFDATPRPGWTRGTHGSTVHVDPRSPSSSTVQAEQHLWSSDPGYIEVGTPPQFVETGVPGWRHQSTWSSGVRVFNDRTIKEPPGPNQQRFPWTQNGSDLQRFMVRWRSLAPDATVDAMSLDPANTPDKIVSGVAGWMVLDGSSRPGFIFSAEPLGSTMIDIVTEIQRWVPAV